MNLVIQDLEIKNGGINMADQNLNFNYKFV